MLGITMSNVHAAMTLNAECCYTVTLYSYASAFMLSIMGPHGTVKHTRCSVSDEEKKFQNIVTSSSGSTNPDPESGSTDFRTVSYEDLLPRIDQVPML